MVKKSMSMTQTTMNVRGSRRGQGTMAKCKRNADCSDWNVRKQASKR